MPGLRCINEPIRSFAVSHSTRWTYTDCRLCTELCALDFRAASIPADKNNAGIIGKRSWELTFIFVACREISRFIKSNRLIVRIKSARQLDQLNRWFVILSAVETATCHGVHWGRRYRILIESCEQFVIACTMRYECYIQMNEFTDRHVWRTVDERYSHHSLSNLILLVHRSAKAFVHEFYTSVRIFFRDHKSI